MSERHMQRRRAGRSVVLILGAVVALGWILPAVAQTKPAVTRLGIEHPASALYVGSSFFFYNNGLPGHVNQLLTAADPPYKLRTTLVAISGAGLNWHDVDSYFRPGAIGMYSFDSENRIVFNQPAKLFDVAILSDCSQCPIHPQLKAVFFEYAKKHSATIRKHGATPVLFMTWAYADEPQMTAQLAEAYTLAGNQNNALVIPAGLAFARSVGARPGLNLYIGDKRHPSLAGTYLAACTVYASLFHKSPVGLAYRAGLDADTARFLQTAAWDTVQEYFGD
jgi:hypothetical protein